LVGSASFIICSELSWGGMLDTCRLKKTLLVWPPMDCATRPLLLLLPSASTRVAELTGSVAWKA